MHAELAARFVERIRKRASEGDRPTEAPLSVEILEDLVLTLAGKPHPAPLTAVERADVVEAERDETGGGGAKLDGNEIWEWLFGELRGDVPEALTDDLLARLAAHINCVFIAIPAIGEAALKAPRS